MRRALESDQGKRSAAETELRKVETDIGERNAALRRLRDILEKDGFSIDSIFK